MRPDDRELDDEIRGHLALSVKERIERGEDPEAARLAALREFGYVPADPRLDAARLVQPLVRRGRGASARDMRIALRSLLRAKGLAATVVVTLALGIGANAAIFSVVRGVLLRPLVNRDEDRLIYIRQSAPGHRRREHDVLGARDQRPQVARHHHQRLRRLLDGRLHADRSRRRAPHGEGGRRRRVVLRRDGPSPRARPPAERAGRRPEGGGRGGPDVPVLDHLAQQRPGGHRQDHPPRSAHRDRGRRPRAVGAVSGRHRDHRERRDEPASPRRDDGHRAARTG